MYYHIITWHILNKYSSSERLTLIQCMNHKLEKPYQITSEKSDALSRNKTYDTPVLWWGALD